MSLSSLIVQRGIATIREVEEALARQVLYGGDLVTNLFEVSRVEEALVTSLLAESFDMIAATAGELPPPADDTKALVPLEIASARTLLPLGKKGNTLQVAVAEPLGKEAEKELTFALGLVIEQRIAPGFRIRQAIAREYGAPLERRVQRLLTRIAGSDARGGSSLPPLLRDASRGESPKPRKYPTAAGMTAVKEPTISEKPLPPLELPPSSSSPLIVAPPPSSSPASSSPASAPPVSSAPTSSGAGIVSSTDPAPPPVTEGFPPSSAPSAPPSRPPGLATLTREAAAPAPTRARRRRGPLSPDTAREELDEATDREAILSLLFDFARQYFDYAVLFLVHSDLAEGRDAFGDGAGRDRVVTIGVPLDMPSILSRARDRNVPVVGVPAADGLDAMLMADLSRKISGPVLVVPVVVRSRTVALLFGDSGAAGVDEQARGEVAAFAMEVGQAFEKLIVRKKLGGFKAGAKGEAPSSRASAGLPIPTKKKTAKSEVVAPSAGPQRIATLPAGPPPTVLSPRAQSMPPPSSAEPALIEAPVLMSGDASAEPADSPPPSNLFQVRKPSGKPIPREEPAPEEHTQPSMVLSSAVPTTVDVRGEKQRREGRADSEDAPSPLLEAARAAEAVVFSHATIAQAAVAGAMEEARKQEREEAGDAAGDTDEEDDIDALLGGGSFPEPTEQDTIVLEVEAPSHVSSSQPGPESSAISVPARRPPSARTEPEKELPSIIVDVGAELSELVDRMLAPGGDETAEAELLRQGQTAMPAIMSRFPGPITVDPDRLALVTKGPPLKELPVRVVECGPLLRLIAGQRRVALPFVLRATGEDDAEHRFWATFLLTELVYPESAERLVPRLFDEETRTRKVARLAARALAEAAPMSIVEQLGDIALATLQPSAKRVSTVDILGEMRESVAVPLLVSLLQDGDELVGQSAHLALVTVTRQDYGTDARRWLTWWSGHGQRHRIEWLIDALMHEEARLRHAAGEELKTITKEYFGYYDDLPKRERERAQQRYRDWWSTEGRQRFRRT